METIIKGVLAHPNLQDKEKSTAISKLLEKTFSLSKPDASVLLDLGIELKSNTRSSIEVLAGDRILLAMSIAHRDLFWARFANDWFETQVSSTETSMDYVRNIPLFITVAKRKEGSALTEEDKQNIAQDMETLQKFAEKRCINANPPLEHAIQCVFVLMFVALPASRPLAISNYIELTIWLLCHHRRTELHSPKMRYLCYSNAGRMESGLSGPMESPIYDTEID
ncbi:hypothetical protein BGX21_002088 [Mortierella sp. AD011]|nr:hypothetical protein BGX21_002088 [Mortierella sp. AD011]